MTQGRNRNSPAISSDDGNSLGDKGFRIEDLSKFSGTTVDTIRYYQHFGLLPPPIRNGRVAFYGQDHLEVLRRISELKERGWSLAAIKSEHGHIRPDRATYGAGIPPSPVRLLTLSELADETELPEAILLSLVADRILEPTVIGSAEYFSEFDLFSAKAALDLLRAGLPLAGLMEIAKRYKSSINGVLELAVGIFDGYIRKNQNLSDQQVLDMFDELFEASSALVVNHFRSELLRRSLETVLTTGSQAELDLISQRVGITLQKLSDLG